MGFISKLLDKIPTQPPRQREWYEGNDAYYSGSSEEMCPYPEVTGCNRTMSQRRHWLNGFYGRK